MAPHLIILLLAIFSISVASQSNLLASIDCGTSASSTDQYNIQWTGDVDYIQTGEQKMTTSKAIDNPVLSTLRVFKTNKKNCYSIKVGKGVQVLVRASFYYGDYDGNGKPPTFDLQFDGNHWATVNTTLDGTALEEVIYIVRGDNTSVCLAQTNPNQFPFISALEIRRLGPTMYPFNHISTNYAFIMQLRVAEGATQQIRYSLDSYDRIWLPGQLPGYTTVRSSARNFFPDGRVMNAPPIQVLQNALTTATTSSFALGLSNVGNGARYYANMYFSEVEVLGSNQKRSFNILIDNKPTDALTVVPIYGGITERYISNFTLNADTVISLVPTVDSNLPPILNGFEVFTGIDIQNTGTNSKDVEGLAVLQSQFVKLKASKGDPCLPSPYTWDWVNCSADATPRVTALLLGGAGLSGSIPDFSSMDALQIIEMQNNKLTDTIPEFLGKLPDLRLLNLEENNITGPIPSSLKNNAKVELKVAKCVKENKCNKGKFDSVKIIVAPIASVAGLILTILGVLKFCLPKNFNLWEFCCNCGKTSPGAKGKRKPTPKPEDVMGTPESSSAILNKKKRDSEV